MKQPNIVLRFLFPADQNPAKAIQPTMRSFNNPTPGLFSGICLQFSGLNASGLYVCGISEFLHKLPHLIKIIAFIKAEVLLVVLSWFRAVYGDTAESWPCHFHVVPVCSIYGKANRNSRPITQNRSFDTCFTPVSRVFACFFPRPAGPWSWLHPWLAISSQAPSDRHIPAARFSKTQEKPLLFPILGIVRALLNQSICLLHQGPSIGTLFLRRTGFRSLPFYRALAFFHPRADGCLPVLAAMAQFCSKAHQKFSSGLLLFFVSSFSPAASLP